MEIVYKVPGKNHGPDGKTFDWKKVKSKDDFEASLKDGWFDTLEEALAGKHKKERKEEIIEDISDDAPTREEMEIKAKELGLTYHKNISDKKLLALIEKNLKD